MEEPKTMACNFYTKLFTSDPASRGEFTKGRFLLIKEEVKQRLEAVYTWGYLEGPKWDGIPKGTWSRWVSIGVLRENLGDYRGICSWIFSVGTKERGYTSRSIGVLVLITREEKPISIRNFRPISLCNVYVKIVIKMTVNHLKEVLYDIMSLNQASFIHSRQSIDNVMIFQEVIHTFRYTKFMRDGMVLKLNLEKACDRMEWHFVGKNPAKCCASDKDGWC